MGMLTSLFSAVSGLNANGQALSVIGDNIANANTVGFKGSRAAFGDILSQSLGGTSALQVGRGVLVSSITPLFSQGTFESSSNPLDLAIDGDGFFILHDVSGAEFYTRAGLFTLDKDGNIVNPDAFELQGKILQGSQSGQVATINVSSLNSPPNLSSEVDISTNLNSSTTVHDPTLDTFVVTSSNQTIFFTDSGGANKTATLATGTYTGSQLATEVDTKLTAASTDTYTVDYGTTTANKFTITSSNAAFDLQVENASFTAERLLGFTTENDAAGVTKTSDYTVLGDSTSANVFTVTASNNKLRFAVGSTNYDVTITAGSYTANELAKLIEDGMETAYAPGDFYVYYDQVNRKFTIDNDTGSTVVLEFDASTNTTIEQLIGFNAVEISLATGSTATSSYAAVGFDPTDAADTSDFSTSITVYDSLGNSHLTTVYFRKTKENETLINDTARTGNTWHWHSVIQASDSTTGQIAVGGQGYLEFDTEGKLVADIQEYNDFDFSGGVTQSQSIAFDFGTSTEEGGSGLTGSTQFGSANSVTFQVQDGYSSGSLKSLSVGKDGIITGTFTNGQTQDIAQVYLARFTSPTGLSKQGKNIYSESAKSGSPIIGAANTSGRGNILASSLETSNVDLAEEFVRLIAAQRGFQANTRAVTTTDDLLSELMSIKR
ncbi:MAG: flagellar hook-basal body complex protein [Nitrospirae bacterium]|nr:flagellar hook-basal body complex protein [Nitrospirota bacterium]MCL5978642.1 flagellar hook-basal body complex protein [Nitrospirota bacterium]